MGVLRPKVEGSRCGMEGATAPNTQRWVFERNFLSRALLLAQLGQKPQGPPGQSPDTAWAKTPRAQTN